jgi:tRNA A-37 threonylcarbamoyl transferase component Bud32
MNDVKVFSYVDVPSRLILWEKAILFLPVWGFAAVPIIGGIFGLLGSVGEEVGYVLTLCFFLLYFLQDVLKTKIRIQNDTLHHGFQSLPLTQLASVALEYPPDHILPRKLVLNFNSGRKYKLSLARLRGSDTETLVRMIESRYPQAKVDPVLRTISKCKKLASNPALDTAAQVEIPYQSRLLLKQLADTFKQTAGWWGRTGPILCFLAAIPLWENTFTGMYSFLHWQVFQKLTTHSAIQAAANNTYQAVGSVTSSVTGKIMECLSNPTIAFAILMILLILVFHLLRYALRPNSLMLEKGRIAMVWRYGWASFNIGISDWKELSRVTLEAGKNGDLAGARLCFLKADGKPEFKLTLSGINNEDRERLLKSIERFAPEWEIDSPVSEVLRPRQQKSYTELWMQSLAAPPERKNLEPLTCGLTLHDGKYEVIKKLGVGGQGMAYLCLDRSVLEQHAQGQVVLKETILPLYVEQSVRQQALERFQQEAEMLGQLNSDRIVRLLDYFMEDHRGYLVLEHIEGKTLRQLIDEQGAVSEQQALDLAVQMCEILSYLHGQKIIHRDFTPDNLILNHQGKLRLIDFNVAQSTETGSTGTIVGKHSFLPPEQFRGKPTFGSDLYALGATLFFITTGTDPEPISQSCPSEKASAISTQFSQIVARCTELDQKKRFATAADAREAFLSMYNEAPHVIVLAGEKELRQA